jgi:type II secretion system protein H
MRSSRHGFTFIEMLVVFAIVAIIFAIGLPKLTGASASANRHSAARIAAALLSQAKATAIQNGRSTRVTLNNNVITLLMEQGDGSTTTVAQQDLAAAHGVTVSASPSDVIKFDSRGLVVGSIAVPYSLFISRDGVADTVCVIGLGKIATNQCSLTQ